MKKILATILAAALAGGLGGTAWGDDNFYQDSGNASLWHIANLDGLIAFRQSVNNKTTYSGKTIQLDADIDMTGISWLPIGGGTTEDTDTSETWQNYYFAGTFDGKSHVISNLKVTLTKEDSRMSNRVGLFGFVNGGTVKDLVIANVDLTGGWHVAPVAGRGVNATFSGITVRGTVNVDAVGYASGLVANAYTGNVRDCVVNGTLNISGADGDTGGIAGGGYANISDCVVVGVGDSVISGGEFTGGIKGYSGEGNVKVERCSVSNVTVAATSCGAGGVFGGLQYGNRIIDCNVYDVTVVGNNPINSGVIGLIAGSSLGTESSPCFIYGCSVSNSTATVDGVQTFSLCGDKNWDGESNGNGYVYFNSDKTSTVNDNTVALTSGTYSVSPESVVAGKTAVSVSYTAKSYVAEGISVADNSNGTWTIGTPSPVASPVNLGSVTMWVPGSDKWAVSLGFKYQWDEDSDPEEIESYYNSVVADSTIATINTDDDTLYDTPVTVLNYIHAVSAGETTIECQLLEGYDWDDEPIFVPARFTVVVRAPDPDAPAVLGYSSVGGYTIGYATEDGDTVATLTAEAEAMGLTVVATGTYSEMTNLKDNHVAKIGNVPYLTLQAALEAATNGTAVELLSDVDEDIAQIPALQNVTLDFCGHTLTGQLKGYYSKKIDGLLIKNGTIVGRDSNNWANLQIANGSKNVVVENMTLTTVRNNGSRSGYAFYNQSGTSVALRNVVADGRFYVGNSGSIIAIESGTYRNTFNGAHAIQNNGVVAAKGGTFYYDPTTPNNLVADGYVAIETNDVDDVQCWVIERGPSLATVTLADGKVTEYWDINEAFGAIEEGCTLTIKPGEYTLAAGTGAAGAYNLPANVTIVGAGDSASDVRISSLNQTDPKGLILSGSGITVSNIYFKAEQNEGSALVIRGSGTVVDCVLDGMNETYHCVSDGMYQGIVNGTLHFLRCSILAERYAINVGETSGEVIIEDCTVKGWSSFGSGVKVTVLNTTFAEGTVTEPDYSSPYNDIRFYDDAFISNCTFNAQMEVNVCYESRTGIKLIVDDSTYQGEGTLSSIITESATQSSASSSDIANNYVAVGTGIELDDNGYITGGLFETVDNALIAPECVTGSNSDGETNVSYPTAVGWLRVTDIEPQPGATEMKATYAVTAVVVNDEGETIGIFASQQIIEACIADADVAGSTLAKFDVSKVLETAFAAAGEDAVNVTKVEIRVVIFSASSGEGSVTYEVHPEAVVTVTEDATDTTTTIPLSNACLAADASFTFDLDATGVVAAGDWAKVTHVSTDPNYAAEARNLKAVAGDGGKVYVTVTTTHFSTFTIGAGVPPVTFGVRSDNLFGSIKIEGNVASNLYVATLFEGFEADGALRKAQDVVHATNLTAGTKMYVYDKNADKYDVFEVDANGKWAAADKLTVDVEGKATFDTADLTRGVTNGTGVIVGRKNTAETVYVYGQVPKIPIASTTFGAGQTLVSPPYTNGVEYVDLNASTWTGVKATQLKRLKNQKGADYIQFRTADNRLVKYFYLEGEGWGVVPTQVSQFSEFVANGKALIPVGTAFWYYSTSGGAKVEWK